MINVSGTWSITNTESYPASAAPYAPDSSGELNILLHDGDTLGVDGAQIGVLKQVHQEGLGSLLERKDGLGLPAELLAFRTAIEGYFTDLFERGAVSRCGGDEPALSDG